MKTFSWQLPDWPAFTFARSALRDELAEFARAFRAAEKALRQPQDPFVVAQTLTAEAVTTSAIEGVEVDAAIVMSSICRALGISGVPLTAARDPAELAQTGAIVPMGDGPKTRYLLNHSAFTPGDEPIDGINEGINESILRLVHNHPGRGVPFFLASVKASRATVERAVRALVAAGRIEHRGSRKTGGYFATQSDATMHNAQCTMLNAQ